MPGHLEVNDTHKDFPFTEEHRALWEVSEEEKAILHQGMTAYQKALAAQKKEREKTRVKGKVQKLKGETQLQKEILANADKVEEQGATAKALRARDKATTAVMKEQERHDEEYDPDENNEDNTSQSSISSSNNSSSGSCSSCSSKTSEQSTTSSSSTDKKKKKKKKKKEQEEEVEKQTRNSQGQHKAKANRSFPRWEAQKAVSTCGDGVTA